MKPYLPSMRLLGFLGKGIKTAWGIKPASLKRRPWLEKLILTAFLGGWLAAPAAMGAMDIYKREQAMKTVTALSREEIAVLPHASLIDLAQKIEPQMNKPGKFWRYTVQLVRLDTDAVAYTLKQDEAEASLFKLYRYAGLDPDYLKATEPQRVEWLDFVANHPFMTTAKTSWLKMDNEARVHVLQKILDKHSAIYGFKSTPLVLYDHSDPKCLENHVKTVCDNDSLGLSVDSQKKIYINLAGGKNLYVWDDFEAALATAVHENTHAHQHQLVDRLKAGKIKKSDPIWEQVEMFRINDDIYASSDTSTYRTYQSQPMERESWNAERWVLKARKQIVSAVSHSVAVAPPATTKKADTPAP